MIELIDNLFKKYNNWLYHIVRIGYGILWLDGVKWKVESLPDFGVANNDGLYYWVTRAIEYPVFMPYSLFVEKIVLPNFLMFGWSILLIELILGIGFIIGKKIQYLGLLAILQTISIILSVAKTPNEWIWSYILMILVPLALIHIYISRLSPRFKNNVARDDNVMG